MKTVLALFSLITCTTLIRPMSDLEREAEVWGSVIASAPVERCSSEGDDKVSVTDILKKYSESFESDNE